MLEFLFLGWGARQQIESRQLGLTATRAAETATRALTQTDLLQMDVEKLLILTEALWQLLRDRQGYSDEDLVRKIQEIDLRDGKLDGKVAGKAPTRCSKCKRALSPRLPNCMFCGAPAAESPFKR